MQIRRSKAQQLKKHNKACSENFPSSFSYEKKNLFFYKFTNIPTLFFTSHPITPGRRRIPKLEHSLDDTDEDLDVKTKFPLDLKMVVGRKGRPMLLMGGYAFFRNNSNKNKTYWLCAKSRSLKCRARIITLDGSAGLILKNQIHNHDPCEKPE